VHAEVPGLDETPAIPYSSYSAEFEIDQRPIAIIDLAGRFVDTNDAFHREVGIATAELAGRPITEVWAIDPLAPDLERSMTAGALVFINAEPSEMRPSAPPATLTIMAIVGTAGQWIGCSIGVKTEASLRQNRQLSLDLQGFQLSFDQVEVGMLITGVDGFVIKCNPAMARLFGRTHAEIAEADIISMIHPDHRQAAIEQGLRVIIGEIDSYSNESCLLADDGSPIWVHETSTVVRDTDGNPLHFISQFIDIRDRKQAEAERDRAEAELTTAMEALRQSEAKIKFLVEGTPVPLIEIDADFVIRSANAALEALLGRPPLGVSATEIIHPDDLRALAETYLDQTPDTDWIVEFRVLNLDGTLHWIRSHARIHHDNKGAFRSATATWNDITETRQAETLLRLQASTDALTGLPNRATFFDRLDHALNHPTHTAGLAVLFIDLDHFKPVNDRWGHETGDELLTHVAHRLNTCVRDSDTVARIGGDEFVILAQPINLIDDAITIAQRIVDTLAQPFTLNSGTATITASVGLAMATTGTEPRHLVHQADLAAYHAKASGRSQLAIAPAPR
jgi:diguanylate cyclase (GGDEF)-like protein/PAS domain S-box-containing protein